MFSAIHSRVALIFSAQAGHTADLTYFYLGRSGNTRIFARPH